MLFRSISNPVSFRSLGLAALLALLAPLVLPVVAWCVEPETSISEKWDEVSSLRRNGKFDAAIEVLQGIIQEYSDSEEVLRLAYNQLLFTLLVMKDDRRFDSVSREALERFPDLTAPPPAFPEQIDENYDRLRKEMYGSLSVGKPKDARVFLDGSFLGEIPLEIPLVRVGSHRLMVTKSGHDDHQEQITIVPGGSHRLEISMDRQRGKGWWLARIGAAAVAGTVLALTLGGDEAATAQPEPLPGPPDPPSR